MHKKFRKYSRESQKLIYWLINDYANHISGKAVGYTSDAYSVYQAKQQLKKLYLKHSEVTISKIKPFDNFRDTMTSKITDTLKKGITDASKTEIIIDDVESLIRQEFQKLTLVLDGTFSLSLNLMSQKGANKFIEWLFSFMLQNDIALRQELIDLYSESENNKYIFACLQNKKCCVCGNVVTGPHHVDRVGTGGYKNDTGLDKRISPLCNYHHAEIEEGTYTNEEFKQKYKTYGYILCSPEQIEKLKKVYPHHFKAYKGGINAEFE